MILMGLVAKGPGSYTGVRIGVTTAKTLAYALNTKLYGVSSLALAATVKNDKQKLVQSLMRVVKRYTLVFIKTLMEI